MRPGTFLIAALLMALTAGCGSTTISPERAAPARPSGTPSAFTAVPAADPAARALGSYTGAMAGPADGAALRRALDQVELALALAPADHSLRGDLLAAEVALVAEIALLDAERAPEATAASAGPTEAPAASRPVAGASPRPAAPAPAAPAYALATRKSFEGSGNSGQFASCVDVQILGRGGPVGGAVIGINNGDHSYQDQTDQNGYSGRCGLGASTWSVVLFWTPEGGQARGGATTVYVSGAPEQRAAVVFQER